MNKVILLGALSILIFGISAQSKKTMPNNPKTSVSAESETKGIVWMSMNDALSKTKKTKKKILIDFYTDWCGWCKRMDKATYEDPRVVELVNKYFLPVKFNAEAEGPIKFKGKDYALKAQGVRSTHELAATLLNGQMAYPTTTFIANSHDPITNVAGYIDANEMISILKFFGEDKHLVMTYDEYKRELKAKN